MVLACLWGILAAVPPCITSVKGLATTPELQELRKDLRADLAFKADLLVLKANLKAEVASKTDLLNRKMQELHVSLKGMEVSIAALASARPLQGRG